VELLLRGTHCSFTLFFKGFRFIGVVKTAYKRFPRDFFGCIEMPNRGAVAALTARYKDTDVLAFVYCDRERRHFISTCSNAAGGEPIDRTQRRQVAPVESNLPPVNVRIMMNCPKAAEIYLQGMWADRSTQSGKTSNIGDGTEDPNQDMG
jgi:hypothetical protein